MPQPAHQTTLNPFTFKACGQAMVAKVADLCTKYVRPVPAKFLLEGLESGVVLWTRYAASASTLKLESTLSQSVVFW